MLYLILCWLLFQGTFGDIHEIEPGWGLMIVKAPISGFIECRAQKLTVIFSESGIALINLPAEHKYTYQALSIKYDDSWDILDMLTPGFITLEGTPSYFEIGFMKDISAW